MKEESLPPKVFISYSHDSSEHKRWVTEFASKLVKNGVDVLLDQWDLNLGDDIPKFMEKSVKDADRVLMICTEPYVHKADDGKGGVGYEAMIVTGELVRDLGTSKFVPIVRQKGNIPFLPKSVSTRFYVDLSDEDSYDEQFETLLRELHQIPAIHKPAIGKNPFAVSPSGKEVPEEISDNRPLGTSIKVDGKNVIEIYEEALVAARNNDLVVWRRLVRDTKLMVRGPLSDWRRKYESSPEQSDEGLVKQTMEGVSAYGALIGIALAGVESGRTKFNNQISVMDDILFPQEWNLSGYKTVVALPEAMAFIYQALHGAMCMMTDQLPLAINFVRTQMDFPGWNESIVMCTNTGVMGWPEALPRKAEKTWNVLISLPDSWPWLKTIFGEDYQPALVAYYLALNVNEYVRTLALNEDIITGDKLSLDIPLSFLVSNDDVLRKAYRLLLNDREQVHYIWDSMGIERTKVAQYWESWIKMCTSWLSEVYRYGFHRQIIHRKLIEEVFSPGTKNH